MDCNQILISLKPTLNVIAEQVPGLVISLVTSFYVAHVYFKRQRKIDENKEREDVKICYRKLMNAYITYLGKRPQKGSFHIHEAMDELTMKLEIYRPEFDAKDVLNQAAIEAAKFIEDHAEDLEDIPKGTSE